MADSISFQISLSRCPTYKKKNCENLKASGMVSHITFIEDFTFPQQRAGMKGYLLDAKTQRKKLETQNMAEDNVPCNLIMHNR